jgi:Flp pilus assembly pilin Flp
MRELQAFWKDESGQDLVEWIAVTLILILATVLIIRQVGDELYNAYDKLRRVIVAIYTGGDIPE